MPKTPKRAKKAAPKYRPLSDLVEVQTIASVQLMGPTYGNRLRALLMIDGKGYWLDAPVTGGVAIL